MLNAISTNVAETYYYKNHWQKIKIVKRELKKGRYVEVWPDLKIIYSARKWGRE